LNEGKCRNFGSDVEPHLKEMTKAPVDVEPAPPEQFKLARSVAPVLSGQEWRRQKRWLALPAVGVSREDPSSELSPDRTVHCIGIVAKHQAGLGWVQRAQDLLWREVWAPIVIQAGNFKAIHWEPFVPKYRDS
jgi:hypothetical protein